MNDELLFKISLNFLVAGYRAMYDVSAEDILQILEDYINDYREEIKNQTAN